MALIDPNKLTSAERLFLSHALILCYFTADNEKEEQEYYFVALPGERLEQLHAVLSNDAFSLEKISELAHIVATGAGIPDAEVKAWVRRNYRINVDALDETLEA